MDTRNSALIVGFYFVGAMAIGVLCYVAFVPAPEVTVPGTGDARQGARPLPPPPFNRSMTTANPNATIRDLQAALAATQQQLDQRTTALHQKSAECRALQERVDQTVALLMSLLDEESAATAPQDAESADAAASGSLAATTAEVPADSPVGATEVAKGRDDEQWQRIQRERILADLEWTAVSQEVQRELELVVAERRSIEDAAGRVIAFLGPEAVTPLIEFLPDERVEVRRWAARMLGLIGPDARDAQIPLRELLADPDPTVREQARESLAQLE